MTKGMKIKMLRNKIGLSQTDLAKIICVSKQSLYKYENDIITNIPSDVIERMAAALNCNPAFIMGWEPEAQAVIDRISNNLTSISGSNILDDFTKDETFMTHIRLLWSLPDEEKKDIYKHIAALYYMSENDRKKEDALNA